MKTFWPFIFLSLFILGSCGSGDSENSAAKVKNDFPSVHRVIAHCNETINHGPQEGYFRLAKKPKGYFLQYIKDEQTSGIDYEVLVWSAKSREFQDFKLQNSLDFQKDAAVNFRREAASADSYDFHLYYGYGDWSIDIITALEKVQDPNLWQLEQLARAYDNNSMFYIRPGIWGNRATFAEKFEDNQTYGKISPKRIEKFMEAADKSLSYYEKIAAQQKDYETFKIGDVRLKIANNYMHYYATLLSVKENKKALKYLNKAKYPKAYEELAKTYLEHCKKEAILFTQGDTDTFPLWFMQAKKNYRKDVNVINISLLQTYWYAEMQEQLHGLNVATDVKALRDKKSYYVVFEYQDAGETTDVSELINKVNTAPIDPKYNAPKLNRVEKFQLSIGGNDIQFAFEKGYLTFNELMILDLIESNPEKSIYATSPYNLLDRVRINRYFANRGIIHEFTSDGDIKNYDSLTNKIWASELQTLKSKSFAGWQHYGGYLSPLTQYVGRLWYEDPDNYKAAVRRVNQALPSHELWRNEKTLNLYSLKVTMMSGLSKSEIKSEYKEFRKQLPNLKKSMKLTDRTLSDDIYTMTSIIAVFSEYRLLLERDPTLMADIEELQEFIGKIQPSKKLSKSHASLPFLQNLDRQLNQLKG